MSGLVLDPGTVIDVGQVWTLAVNRNQNLLGKTLLVLNRECSDVLDLTPIEWQRLHDEMTRVTSALAELFQPDQFNYSFLMNADAQVHLHVLPRYASPREWNGVTFVDSHFGEAAGHEVHSLDTTMLRDLAVALASALP